MYKTFTIVRFKMHENLNIIIEINTLTLIIFIKKETKRINSISKIRKRLNNISL